MRSVFFQHIRTLAAVVGLSAVAGFASAEPQHGIAMYGDPVLPPDFVSLPYATPDAPKGGSIRFGEPGGFDSLNPHIRKGRAPWGVRTHVFESLMGRSYDEPFSLYGLLAESIEVGENREWVQFTLRPEARFSDDSPVTVEDVLWSYETLGTVGHPRYHTAWNKVATSEAVDDRTVRFTFNTVDAELPLLMGMRPILQKAQYEGVDFAESTLEIVPIGSAPYVIADFEPNRYVILKRNPDYWGKDLPFMSGQANLDEIRYDFFGDGDVVFEAFKAGEITSYRETNAAKWEAQYDFPAVRSGDIVQSLIPHQRPSGIEGFVMNTRRDVFADWRVRDAMLHAFNFEFINQTLNGGVQPRITSYFSNSVLGMQEGPAEGRVAELLEPFAESLLPGALEGYTLPVSDGSARNRGNMRRALGLLEEAGYTVENGVMIGPDGQPMRFEILLQQGATATGQIMDLFADALKQMGITPQITTVDSAQFQERTTNYDFDMAYYRRGLSLSPGNEQLLYWGSDGVDQPGTRNWMGVSNPAIEAMINEMLNASDQDDFRAAVRALDRVLTSGRYVIPIWHNPVSRLAHVKELKFPERLPMYGDWPGFQPDVWWYEE
ncbi:extracellular solute-binding protein [Cognatishimia sp. MH4019]|uniref:extracellular solute-binding protein n=1 Tax=Cognatishimia sp. MH4019 TaxID=2854030 RepID=UPI001CD57DB9|nr:extracellular solute-binding protein [Cognatishimia sp. MH4019]